MKKISALALSICLMAFHGLHAMQEPGKDDPIKNASYGIYEGAGDSVTLEPQKRSTRYIAFYSFDGELLESFGYAYMNGSIESLFDLITSHLDPHAPKPQPKAYTFKGYGKNLWTICFFDKNGHQIKSYRYRKNDHTIVTISNNTLKYFVFDESNPQSTDNTFPLDLSKLEAA